MDEPAPLSPALLRKPDAATDRRVAPPAAGTSRQNALRFVPTLVRKNWWLKRKHPLGLALEIIAPVLFVVLISIIKHQTTTYNVAAGFSVDQQTNSLFSPYGSSVLGREFTPKYVIPETTLTGLVLAMGKRSFDFARDATTFAPEDRRECERLVKFGGRVSLNASSPFAIPQACGGRVSPFKLAIVPDNTFTRRYFYETVSRWYPSVVVNLTADASLVIPSLADSVVFYDTEKALTDYVKSKDYAKTDTQHRIYGALVFDQAPADEQIGQYVPIEYKIRLNATFSDEDDKKRLVPRTIFGDASTWKSYRREMNTLTYQQYTTGGFMTLQTLVARFLNCMPKWDAATKSTTGECQAANSTAVTNDAALDDRLLQTLTKDPPTKQLISEMIQILSENGSSTVNTTALTALVTAESFTLPLTNAQKTALLRPLRQAPQPYLGGTTSPFPIDSYAKSTFYDVIENVFPVFFVLSYLLTLSKILVSLISERETRARELMKILGVKESSIVISWYITYICILLVSAAFQVTAAKLGLFENSHPFLLFIFFLLFSFSILGYAFMVSSIFSKARTGAYVGIIGFFVMYSVSNAFSEASSESSKNIACLFAPTAMVFGVQSLSAVETTEVGMTMSNVSSVIDNFRFSTALVFFVIDTILYTIIGLYLEKVVPKAYGTPEKWYFPVMPSYWRRRRERKLLQMDEPTGPLVSVDVNPNIEPVSVDLAEQERTGSALCVEGLRKVFKVPSGEKVAVHGLHLNMYEGQITCLLGHNGAGKTTLISMLTGVIPPTSGDAYFQGLSVRENMDEIRESLGICFQHDVLYPELTVEEHLEFFGRIKGYQGDALANEVKHKIAEVGLVDKSKTISSALSGGMKRKLSVAISLLGDSSLVFLDEPTSGMDPYSRRSTWEILMNNRHNRVLVLTTHFMDEADILGDRIAIMAEGELRCCGSPLFLKNRYGAGYNLTIIKEENCDDSKVIDFVLRYIPTGKVLSNVGTEIAFQLPLDVSPRFAAFFKDLDDNLKSLRALSYGVSVTTMEEVFIKVAEAADDENDQQHTLQNRVKHHVENPDGTNSSTSDCSAMTKTRPTANFSTHFFALVQKRFRIAKRDRRFVIISLLLPVFWLVVGLSLLQAGELTKVDPLMPLAVDKLASEVSSGKVLLPSYCESDSGGWCESALSKSFTGAVPVILDSTEIDNPPYPSDKPTVFGVQYSAPDFNKSDTSGYLLKLSEAIYERGYAKGNVGQFGGYLGYSDARSRVLSYNILVNTSVDHGSVVFKRLMDQAMYRTMASQAAPTVDSSKLNVIINNHPLPQTASTTALFTSYLSFSACIFIAIAMAYYPASIVSLLVKERQPEHNSKHQQLVSGVNLISFWLSNYAWDLLVYFIPGSIAVILIRLYDLPALTGTSACINCTSATFPAVIVLFVLFGFAVCPYAYCWSFAFSEHASAQTKVVMINLVLGLGLMIASFAMDMIESTQDWNKYLKCIYRFSPIYSLGVGLLDITILEIVRSGGGEFDTYRPRSPFGLENSGYEMIFLVVDAVLYLAIAIGIDYALTFPKFKAALNKDPMILHEPELEDEDVAAENERVLTGRADKDAIVLQNLRKVYRKGNKVAVKNLSFGLKRGECFGFLGINGAGKTTTMKMLTGDIVPTSGQATLCGFDILTQQLEVRREIGYCPQFDALIDLLSVREHLELFAQIKGVPRSQLDTVVREKMEQLNLTAFEDKLAGSLSGGNKRKLSVAIALIGSPSILFLDEPSTGMDPVSRRFMWDVISEISTYNKESTVVLTTHSMEECEALCTRVGIMVGGGLKCLGSIQHLKNRFGDGLMFDAKLLPPSSGDAENLVVRHFEAVDAHITREQLAETCGLFGQPSWEQKITNTHPTGYVIDHALQRDGYVLASAFATWWLMEERFENVAGFLRSNFGNVELLERQNDSCWFKIKGDTTAGVDPVDKLRLSNVFDVIESAKTAMAIREYSVSQTTLEQIFNSFASQQTVGEPIPTTPTHTV